VQGFSGRERPPELDIGGDGVVPASGLDCGGVPAGTRPVSVEVRVILKTPGNRRRHVLGRDLQPSLDKGNVRW
jgi:hypothetical protein